MFFFISFTACDQEDLETGLLWLSYCTDIMICKATNHIPQRAKEFPVAVPSKQGGQWLLRCPLFHMGKALVEEEI